MTAEARPLCAYTDYGIDFLATKVPGWGPSSKVERLDRDVPAFGLPREVMVELYEQVPHPSCPYIPGVWDCENFARWYAEHVAELWGRLVAKGKAPRGLLAQGAVLGKLPIGELPAGNHGADFFFDDRNRYSMWEPQTRTLLSDSDVARCLETWKLELH